MTDVSDRCSEILSPGLGLLDSVGTPAIYVAASGDAVLANSTWLRDIGPAQAGPWAWLDALVPDSRSRSKRMLAAALERRDRVETEVEVRHPDGTIVEYALTAGTHAADECEEVGMLIIASDITEQRRNEERLAFIAGHDVLTGLPNRRAFMEALGRAVDRSSRGTPSVLLMLDVDRLKAYNDGLGHLAGDQALVNVALLIRRHIRASDTPARIGGDEFAVILEDADMDAAMMIAERMRQALGEEELVAEAREYGLGLSGGLAPIEAGLDVRTVIDRSDSALYSAKAAGRDRMLVWDPTLAADQGPELLSLKVREAFATDGFTLVFQPVVRLSDGRVAYYESLVRMHAADGSVYSPVEFLPILERSGQMSRLTRRVVEVALWQLATVHGCSVSVNLSSSDLSDPALLEDVEHSVANSVAPERLVFEIAEPTLLSNLAQGRRWMRRLGDLGCHFVLDDFGTGIGMFALLREDRVEQVKLSHMVVRALSAESGTRAFVIALREMIESQGKTAVATFLETEQLLGEFESAGFTHGQGYGIREPSGDLHKLIEEFGADL